MRDPADSEVAYIEALARHARAHPGIVWPSSNGYGAICPSTCTDEVVFFRTATETETRYGVIAQDYKSERAALITGESTCRCGKNIIDHIADKHDVSIRTVK